jgi:formate dehydrogenase subunit gamma
MLVILIFLGIYVAAGRHKRHIPGGRQILRFDDWERLVHWTTAITFIIMASTGLIVFFGKVLLLPWMGHEVFAALALATKYVHNVVGLLFILCTVVMFFTFLHHNFLRRWDWDWLRTFGKTPAGFFNTGEKAWFWGAVTVLGLLMSASGLILDFPIVSQTRYVLQWANYLHIAGATLYIMGAIGHIYLGTAGVPGTYHGMRYGTVDEEWAREHHGLWYEDLKSGRMPEHVPYRERWARLNGRTAQP